MVIKSRVSEETLASIVQGLLAEGVIPGNISQITRAAIERLAEHYENQGLAQKLDKIEAVTYLRTMGLSSTQMPTGLTVTPDQIREAEKKITKLLGD